MERLLLTHLLDASIRSLALAMVAAVALGIARKRSAAFAHSIWTAVLLGMLLVFAAGPVLTPLPVRVNVNLVNPRLAAEPPAPDLDLPALSPPSAMGPIESHRVPFPWSNVAAWAYASIALALLGRIFVGWWLAHGLFTGSAPVDARFRESPLIAVPVVVGWIRPSILLPPEWRDWDRRKLEAVLAHENAHVRRRDSLTTLLAGFTRSLFWFHPLAWWIEHRLALLAEQACDEACLCILKDRWEYARLLLEMASAVEGAGARVPGHVLAIARPSQVRRRIDAVLDENSTAHPGLSWTRWSAVLLCSVPAVYAAGALRLERMAGLPAARSIPVPSPVLVAQVPVQTPAPAAVSAPAKAPPAANDNPFFAMVSVQTPDGRYVTGLGEKNFRVMQGNEAQTVTSFAEAEGQHAIGVVLTTTADVTSAVDDFQRNLHPQDESFVVQAGSSPVLDAISAAVVAVQQRKNPAKALVVITQDAANNPVRTVSEVSAVIRKASGVSIYVANITADIDMRKGALSQEVDLDAIARITGGQYILASSAGLADSLHQLAIQFRSGQYMLGFVPRSGQSGRYRRLSIELLQVQELPPLHVTSPWGYMW